MNKPEITVIMPNYNGAKYIEESIKSVQNQHFLNWELLVIDDHSTDLSLSIIEEIAQLDPRIHVFKQSERKGPGAARNIGLSHAIGRFITFLDSDDYWPDYRLRLQMEEMLQKKICFSYGDYNRILLLEKPFRIIPRLNATNYHELLGAPVFSIITTMIDRKAVTLPRFNEQIYRAEDYLFHLEILNSNIIAFRIPKVLASYRFVINSNSAVGCMPEMWWIFNNKLDLTFYQSALMFSKYLKFAVLRRLQIVF